MIRDIVKCCVTVACCGSKVITRVTWQGSPIMYDDRLEFFDDNE